MSPSDLRSINGRVQSGGHWNAAFRSTARDSGGLGTPGVVSIRRWIGKEYSSHHWPASSQDRGAARPLSCATRREPEKPRGRAASVPHPSFNHKNLLLRFSSVCSTLDILEINRLASHRSDRLTYLHQLSEVFKSEYPRTAGWGTIYVMKKGQAHGQVLLCLAASSRWT